MRTELRKWIKNMYFNFRVCLHFDDYFVSRSSKEKDEKLVLEKVEELSSLASPQIAGALIKKNTNNKKPKIKVFCQKLKYFAI